MEFLEDLMLNVCKGYMFLSTCENIWLQSSMLRQCPHVMFPFHSTLVEEAISTMIIKTMNLHVLLHLAFIMTIFASFNI